MNTEKSTGLIAWIKSHPHKAMLLLFLILIPVFLLIVFGVSFTIQGKSFYFDKNENEEIIYLRQSDLSSQKTLDEYFEELSFELEEVSGTTNQDDEAVKYGKFKFSREYKPTSYYKDATFTFRYVMTANWFDEQSNVLDSNSSSFTIEFPYNLPKHKLLILKVNKPILYVEINIVRHTSGGNDHVHGHDEHTLYYKYDLNNVQYTNVKP
ncbi:MAG TPA: hypothetical protein GX012_02370 [Acholeplasma sp.]|nr:hypothetical protein [Acholeplasma sp.]